MERTKRLCFALLAAMALVSARAQARDFKLLDLDGHTVKWGTPQFGTGALVTYAVATTSSSASGIENCRKTEGISALLTNAHVRLPAFQHALSNAFNMWSDVADVHFRAARPGERIDLIIAAQAVPDGIAYSDVTPTPAAHAGTISQAIICLNPQAHWTTGIDPDSYRLFYVLAHEIGHTIGLDHPSPSGELMSFEYNSTLQTLQSGDIAAAILLYGAAHHGSLALNAH